MADHNDPNAVNSIFSDVDVSAADLYDLFGFPSDDKTGREKVVIALTFAAVPKAGVFDTDLLYRIRINPHERVNFPAELSLEQLLRYFDESKDRYLSESKAYEVRVTVDESQKATIKFMDFPGGAFTKVIDLNQPTVIQSPDGHAIQTFIGGRDDAFFNDLPGFFRSINYAPQFYHVPHTMTEARELPIPKTLLELEGNDLFNFNPANPHHGAGVKLDLPPGPWEWKGDKYKKDSNGNFRFVYSGKDAQAGRNINCIVLEMPMALLTAAPDEDRVIDCWGESWVRKATAKVPGIPDTPSALHHPLKLLHALLEKDDELKQYKLVDTDGQAFADAALSERENDRQLGANNFFLGPHFVLRLAHLGWGFGPSVSALGLKSSFDHDNSPVGVHKTDSTIIEAFPRVKKMLFQPLRMPDNSWNPKGLDIAFRRPIEVFVPNCCAIDMDTTGTWPFGRRFEDQVATRFLSLFLDMEAEILGAKYNVELLNNQALWDASPIEPKTPPNPLKNDAEFSKTFPYLAAPW